jgi:hypothetical protein
MPPSKPHLPISVLPLAIVGALLALIADALPAQAQAAYVRVSQVGYEAGEAPFRAYLMSTAKGKRSPLQRHQLEGRHRILGPRRRAAGRLEP